MLWASPGFVVKSLLLGGLVATCFGVLVEDERVEEYHRRRHTWPPSAEDYTPSTPGWQKINERRFEQIARLQVGRGERYQAYKLSVHSALISNNFTEYGFAVTRAPQPIIDKLRKRLFDGLAQERINHEGKIACVETKDESLPYFFSDDKMNSDIMHELLPLHEAWAGVELVPNNAYGLRAYRNNTNLNMHTDKSETHVISSILHVAHGENDEPWPIIIEDFLGNTNEVYLESGDMLFYESSKLFHGRPTTMKGEFYSSLFTHYYPRIWNPTAKELDVHYRIPPEIWQTPTSNGDEYVDELFMVETSMKEPSCEDAWCGLKNTKKWYGPGPEYGKFVTGDSVIRDLENIPDEESFLQPMQRRPPPQRVDSHDEEVDSAVLYDDDDENYYYDDDDDEYEGEYNDDDDDEEHGEL